MSSLPSPRRLRPPWALGWAMILCFAQSTLAESDRPQRPSFYAIRNARVVTGTGAVLERGTLVLARGLISEVGPDVAIPPEAWVIDGTGLTVYPGLIDALSDVGLQVAEPGSEVESSGAPGLSQPRPQPIAQGPEDRPATTTWKSAADELHPEDKRLESWRSSGFTSAVTVSREGIFPGQAALINLSGERPGEMVVRAPVALPIRLDAPGGFRSFPGSLMGVLAYVKQVFADAEHYEEAGRTYEASPKGNPRPDYDRTLEPLIHAKSQRLPVLIPGTWAKEIERAIRLGEEIGAHTVIYGAHQGYAAVDVLKSSKVPVLVSLKWPEKSEDADPDADIPLRVLKLWDQAPSTPASLQANGIRFAFYSDGLKTSKEAIDKARKAIERGLSKDAALQAFTRNAAEIFGVADRLGTLEPGKIANLLVAEGDLFDEGTKIRMVFVDGRKIEVRETGEPEPTKAKPGAKEGGR